MLEAIGRRILLCASLLAAGVAAHANDDARLPPGFRVWANRVEPRKLSESWEWFPKYWVDARVTRTGSRSLALGSRWKGQYGACQEVTLNQKKPEPLVLAAFSKAQDLDKVSKYALGVLGIHDDGSEFPRIELPLRLEPHDWEEATLRIEPKKPLERVTVFLIKVQPRETPRGSTTALWFDDVSLTDPSGRDWLANGGFEEDIGLPAAPRPDGCKAPPGWRRSGRVAGLHSIVTDPREAKDGSCSMRIDIPYPADQVTGSIGQSVSLGDLKAETLALSLWAKGRLMPPGGGMVQMIFTPKAGKKWSAWTWWKIGEDWTQTTLKIPVKAQSESAKLTIYFPGRMGTVWFDDVRLEAELVPPPPSPEEAGDQPTEALEDAPAKAARRNYIRNGSFEERRTGLRRGRPLLKHVPPFPSLPALSPEDKRRGYLLSSRSYLDQSHPRLVPEREDLTDRVSLFASPGEYEPVTFSLTAREDLRKVRITTTDLRTREGATLAQGNLDVRRATYRPMYQHHVSRMLHAPDVWYVMRPHVLEKMECYSIPAGRTQQFWVTVYVPASTRPGLYTGQIRVEAPGRPSSGIGLSVRVLPVRLKTPPVVFGMYLTGLRHRVPDEAAALKRALIDMREHGMNCWPLMHTGGFMPKKNEGGDAWDWSRVEQNLATYREIGFTAPIILGPLYHRRQKHTDIPMDALRALHDRSREKGWPEIVLYVRDEPHRSGTPGTIEAVKQIREFWPEVKTFVAGGSRHYHARMDDGGFAMRAPFVDWPCPGDVDQQVLDEHDGRDLLMYNAGSTGRDALNDRYCFGYYAWRCGLRGVLQFVYTGRGASPDGTLTAGFLVYAHTSPEGGLIPTTAWEGVREGIDDWRYLYTLERATAEARQRGKAGPLVARAEKFLADLRQRIQPNFTRREERFIALENSTFQALRWQAAQLIVGLSEAR